MYAPLTWLKEFVDITLSTKDLAWRLTELGLGVERTLKIEGDDVYELEITPNRPDLLSIIGIAREIAAIEKNKINLKDIKLPKSTNTLPIKINNDFKIFPRYTGVILDNVTVKPSPEWMQKRLKQLGLRSINNIVDITNYVMFETGIPLHAFDYDEIKGQEINVQLSKGGEEFTSVDDKSYKLPKNAMVIYDKERLIDLCGIKGGLNSGISNKTKRVYLQVTADDPLLTRKASHALALRSDASAIFERGVDKGGLVTTLIRAASLVLELGGGDIASEIIDLSEKEFKPWNLTLSLDRLAKVLGMQIPNTEVIRIFESLGLSPRHNKDIVEVAVPTYRQDLKLSEDLMEEVARVYGYNNFKPTFIHASIPTHKVAYFKDYDFESKIKNILAGCGYTEVYTYSLIKNKEFGNEAVKLTNPVSLDFEYLRPSLVHNLKEAVGLNKANFDTVNLFEIGRVYKKDETSKTGHREPYRIGLIRNDGDFKALKGCVEELLMRAGITKISFLPNDLKADILNDGIKLGEIYKDEEFVYAELDFDLIEKQKKNQKFVPVSPYPASIEDLTFIIPDKTYIGQIIQEIRKTSTLISRVEYVTSYQNTKTFRIYYQSPETTLTQKNVQELREDILRSLEKNLDVKLKK